MRRGFTGLSNVVSLGCGWFTPRFLFNKVGLFCPGSGGFPANLFFSISDFFRARNDLISVGGCSFLHFSGFGFFTSGFWLVVICGWLLCCLLMLVSSVPIVVVGFLVVFSLLGIVGFIGGARVGGGCCWFACWLLLLVCCVPVFNCWVWFWDWDFSSIFLKKFLIDW